MALVYNLRGEGIFNTLSSKERTLHHPLVFLSIVEI